jgi:hypothetical protein
MRSLHGSEQARRERTKPSTLGLGKPRQYAKPLDFSSFR